MPEQYLRKAAAADIDLLFDWANDSLTRENAFHTQPISYEEHKKWFADKLASAGSYLYIYCSENVPIGQARIDVDGECGLISYSIDNAHRLRGHGGRLLSLLEEAVTRDAPQVKTLIAKVKKTNIASQHKFEQHKYKKLEKEPYFEYQKDAATTASDEKMDNISGGGGYSS